MGRFYLHSFSILANCRGPEGLHLQALLLSVGKFFRLCNNCAKDMEMLRMVLYKPAQCQQAIVTSWGAVTGLLLKPSCLPCDTTPCCAVCTGQLGVCAAWLESATFLFLLCSQSSVDICFVLCTFQLVQFISAPMYVVLKNFPFPALKVDVSEAFTN